MALSRAGVSGGKQHKVSQIDFILGNLLANFAVLTD